MSERGNRPQVASVEHYRAAAYLTPERFYSFGVQVQAVLALGPGIVLEIGPGSGVVRDVLRRSGVRVVTIDIDPRLGPDAVADIQALPFRRGAVDVTLCCQVLEHIPFTQVPAALTELRRVSRLGSVISVPDITPFYHVDLVAPLVRFSRRFPVPWAKPREMTFDGEHHWSIGGRGFEIDQVRARIRGAGWIIALEERPAANAYHHFFVLR